MAFIETVPPEQAVGAVRSMYARQQAAVGYVPNYAKLFSHRPDLMARWAGLLAGIRCTIEPRRFELVTLAAAQTRRSSYCALAHGKALLAFFSEEEVRGIVTGTDLRALTDSERVMMTFARRVAADPVTVCGRDVETLRAHGFSDDEVFDIVATVAGRAFFTTLLDGLGGEPDAAYRDLGTELQRALAVGRPIAWEAVERLQDADVRRPSSSSRQDDRPASARLISASSR